jgi:hypothetical protein
LRANRAGKTATSSAVSLLPHAKHETNNLNESTTV